jgi:hypothetical protein
LYLLSFRHFELNLSMATRWSLLAPLADLDVLGAYWLWLLALLAYWGLGTLLGGDRQHIFYVLFSFHTLWDFS